MVDYPHIIEERLRKTRIVDFHRGKSAVSYSHIFKGCERGILPFFVGKCYSKSSWLLSGECVCAGVGGG